MSNSVRPHRRQPTRLPSPWDSPGKNTGVGCHFLLQCMKVKSEKEVAQSCPTLRDPMDCSLPGSSVHGIFQARVLEWGAIAFSGRLCYHHLNISWNGKAWSLGSFSETNQHLISPLTSTSTFSSHAERFLLVEESWVEIWYIFSLLRCLDWILSGSLKIYTFAKNMKLSWIAQTLFPYMRRPMWQPLEFWKRLEDKRKYWGESCLCLSFFTSFLFFFYCQLFHFTYSNMHFGAGGRGVISTIFL